MKDKIDFSKVAYSHIKPIDFEIIEKALTGDEASKNKIVDYYQPYIRKLATKKVFDRYGNTYQHLDKDLQSELNKKLLTALLSFKILD